jgi:asparagine synthase (glutamine-hydrolysing)
VCGLFGSLSFPPNRARIDIVAHRGPDGSGWQEFDSPAGPVALGHRRLAIIDVSDNGLQPMADPSGRFHLVFNGEIYNYLELREELKAAGHLFRSETDSEVLIEAFRAWREGCLDRLRGMFAFLIWDDRDKRLFAARDRFGIKPLYVVANRYGIAFSSEIKQIIGLPGSSTRMNVARVRDFLISGTSDHTAETMFEGVLQVQPGSCVSIDALNPWNGRFNARRWYAIPSCATLQLSEDDAAERFRNLLVESVRMHLRSDVPVGSCLSGGLDSSSIVCLMADGLRREGHAVNTVSACYDDNSVDERDFIQAVVKKVDAKAHYVFPRAEDVFQRVADITWHQDEPFGSTSIFAQWCVFEAARQNGIKVMLDGQGADEQLAGYHAGYMYYMSDLVRRRAFATLLRTMIERNRMHKASFIDQAQQLIPVLPAPVRRFVLRQRERLVKHAWLDSEALQSLRTAPPVYEIACQANGLPAVRDIASLCLALTFCSNLQMLLHWEDRNSMAHSIEARVPFLDHRLVEFSIALGNEHKIVGADTKRVLRRAMADVLPPAVRERKDKLGFATPENAWFRGPLRAMIVDGVEATLRRFPSLLNRRGARAFVADMLDRRRPVNFALWRIVNIGIWGDRFAVSL